MTTTESRRGHGLLTNSVAIIATSGLTGVLGYVFWGLSARSTSPDAIGVVGTLVSMMSLVALLTAAGFIPLLIRLLPESDSPRFNGLASTALVSTAALAAAGGVVGELLLPPTIWTAVGQPWLVVISGLGSSGTATLLVVDAVLVGARRGDLSLVRGVVASSSRLLGVLGLSAVGAALLGNALHRDVVTLLLVWVGSLVVAAAASVRLLAKAAPGFRFRPSTAWIPHMHRRVGWEHVSALGGQLPTFTLPVVAAHRLPPAQAGVLYVTWMIGSTFFVASTGVSTALLADCADRGDRIKRQMRRALMLTGLILVLPATIAAFLAPKILAVFGPDYALYGSALLVIILVSTIPDAVTNLAVVVLRLRDLPVLAAGLNGGMAMVTIVSCWITLPLIGITSAGWSWLLAQTAGAVVVSVGALISRARKRSMTTQRRFSFAVRNRARPSPEQL